MYTIEEKKLMSLMSGLCVMCGGWMLRHPGELRFRLPSQVLQIVCCCKCAQYYFTLVTPWSVNLAPPSTLIPISNQNLIIFTYSWLEKLFQQLCAVRCCFSLDVTFSEILKCWSLPLHFWFSPGTLLQALRGVVKCCTHAGLSLATWTVDFISVDATNYSPSVV